MSWEHSDGHQKSVLSYVSTVLTILGVLFGVWTSIWEIRIRRATNHLGTICQDADKMGYFVADIPAWWRRIFLYVRRVPCPEAGDLGYFDCGMFDCEYEGDGSVSWRSVFEAYLRARVWAEQLAQDDGQPGQCTTGDLLHRHRHTHRFKADDAARYAVWLMKQKFESRRMHGNPRLKYRLQKCIRWLVGPSPEPSVLKGSKIGHTEHIEPYPLYYAWDTRLSTLTKTTIAHQSNTSGLGLAESGVATQPTPSVIGPVLVRSVRPLPPLGLMPREVNREKTGFHPLHRKPLHTHDTSTVNGVDGSSEGITIYGQSAVHEGFTTIKCDHEDHQSGPVAVVQGSPMVEVSADELAALSTVLDIEVQIDRPYQPTGRGGFGCLLLPNMCRGLTVIRLRNHRSPRSTARQRARNVHSSLLAKHMACGCMPFACTESGETIKTLAITPTLDRAIRDGLAINDC